MHSQGDTDDDPKLNELEDLKQELQIMKFDIVNDLKKSKEENIKNANMLNNSLQFVAEEVVVSENDDDDSLADSNPGSPRLLNGLQDDFSGRMNNDLSGNDMVVFNNSDETVFAKNREKFIHNSFFDTFIDNVHARNGGRGGGGGDADSPSTMAAATIANTNANMFKKSNKYKVSFDFEAGVASRSLYKISEESSNFEKTSEVGK
jgi:hypothetical protein